MILGLEPRLAGLLEAQKRFERMREAALLRFPRGLSDLSYGNPYDTPPEPVLAAMRSALDARRELDLQYTPYGGSRLTRRVVADELVNSHRLPFEWRDVILTPGATSALNITLRAFRECDEGNERDERGERGEADSKPPKAIMITPCWLDYPVYALNLGYEPVFVPADPKTMRLDLEKLKASLDTQTRVVFLSQPWNPTGLFYDDQTLRDVAQVLKDAPRPPILISDESHRDFIPDPESFRTPAAHYDATIITFSFGKRLFIQGQRIGYAAVSPRFPRRHDVARRFEDHARIMGISTPTALMQNVVRRLGGFRPDVSPIFNLRQRAAEALRSAGYRVNESTATYFLLVKSPDPDDFAFAERAAQRGVVVIPSSVFHYSGWFRICVATRAEMVEKGVQILRELAQPASEVAKGVPL